MRQNVLSAWAAAGAVARAWALLGAVIAAGPARGDDRPERRISIKGSDTMVVLVQRWAESFAHLNPKLAVQVTGGGSGTGLAALLNGTAEVAMSSRAASASEREGMRRKLGGEPQEIPVAQDGVAFYIHETNPVSSLTMEQLRAIYLGDVKSWTAVGGAPGRVVPYSRESSSGTYQFVKEKLLGNEDFAPETQSLPGTAAVVDAVAHEAHGIGYGGAVFARGVRELKLKTDHGEVAPNAETVRSGSYPLSRKLFFYVRGQSADAVRAFIDYCLSDAGQRLATSVGYYPVRP